MKKEEKSTVPVLLIKAEELALRFDEYKEFAVKYEKYAISCEVKDADQLAVATNNVGQVAEAIKAIENIRKTLKQPFLDSGKAVDEYAGVLSDPLNKIKERINKKITEYKQLQEALKRQEAEKERLRLEAIANEKKEELSKLERLQQMMKANIYGGTYKTRTGETKTSSGCKTIAQCDAFKEDIEKNFPAPSSFKYCNKEAEEIMATAIEWVTSHRTSLAYLVNAPKEALTEVMKGAAEAAGLQAGQIINSAEEAIEKDTKKEEKKIEKGISDAKKGIRRTIIFEVIDAEAVPVKFKVVSDPLVNAYIQENKEHLFEALEKSDGTNIIEGIKFSVHDQNINR